jgi:hypothetical protein
MTACSTERSEHLDEPAPDLPQLVGRHPPQGRTLGDPGRDPSGAVDEVVTNPLGAPPTESVRGMGQPVDDLGEQHEIREDER